MKRIIQLICVLVLLVLTGCSPAAESQPRVVNTSIKTSTSVKETVDSSIAGNWVLASLLENGHEKPMRDRRKTRVTFENGRYEAWGMQRAPAIGEYSTSRGRTHPELDLTARGHTLKGVYTIEGDVLRIYSFKTNSLSRPEVTNRVPDIVIQTYRRIEKESNKTN